MLVIETRNPRVFENPCVGFTQAPGHVEREGLFYEGRR
jgi:hypothetical protein